MLNHSYPVEQANRRGRAQSQFSATPNNNATPNEKELRDEVPLSRSFENTLNLKLKEQAQAERQKVNNIVFNVS